MPELIRQKIALCEESLSALEKIFPRTYDELFTDFLVLPAVERYFQLVVDSAVDCNNLLLEAKGVSKADTYFGTFTALRDQTLLPAELADSLASSVGLRNALVHRYDAIERKRIYESMKRFIPHFREYLSIIAQKMQ